MRCRARQQGDQFRELIRVGLPALHRGAVEGAAYLE